MTTDKFIWIEVENTDDTVFVSCLGSAIESDRTAMEWSSEIKSLLDMAVGKFLIIDFTGIRILTSLAMGELIDIKFQTAEKQISLGLCGFSPNVRYVFSMTCLDQVFVIEENRSAVTARLKADLVTKKMPKAVRA